MSDIRVGDFVQSSGDTGVHLVTSDRPGVGCSFLVNNFWCSPSALTFIARPKFKIGDVVNCSRYEWLNCVVQDVRLYDDEIAYIAYDVYSATRGRGLFLESELDLPIEEAVSEYNIGDRVEFIDPNGEEHKGNIISFHNVSGIEGAFIQPDDLQLMWIPVHDIVRTLPSAPKNHILATVDEIKKVFLDKDYNDQISGHVVEDLLYLLQDQIEELIDEV